MCKIPDLSSQPSDMKEEADINNFRADLEEWQHDVHYL